MTDTTLSLNNEFLLTTHRKLRDRPEDVLLGCSTVPIFSDRRHQAHVYIMTAFLLAHNFCE